MTTESKPGRIGPINLSAGVRPAQVCIFLGVVMTANCMLLAVPLLKAYVFSEMMHIPKGDQGRLTGNLSMVQQIAVMVCLMFAGSMVDRIGRRKVLIMAMAAYVITLIVYPLASSILVLYLVHIFFGIASTGHTAAAPTMIMDYPANDSRGKFITLTLVTGSIANIFVVNWLASHMPRWLTAIGMTPNEAGRYAFWVVAVIGAAGLAAAILWLREPPHAQAVGSPNKSGPREALANLKAIAAHARTTPEFGLVMAMGCVIRSDSVVLTAFLSLWVVQGATGQGITTIEAIARAGLVSSIFMFATGFAPIAFGWLADRMNRVAMLVTMLVLTGFALMSTHFVNDVMSGSILIVVGLIGVTESGLVTVSLSLLGERAPPELRGSAYSVFALLGTVSVVAISAISGILFDKLGRTSPFVMVGMLNLLFAVLGLWLVMRRRGKVEASAAGASVPAAASAPANLSTAGSV